MMGADFLALSPTATRALTVKQPWASLIASGVKTVENRTWPIPGTWAFCGPLLIHAGRGFDRMALLLPEAREELEAQSWPDWELPSGAIVAVAQEVTCHRDGPGCCDSPYAQPGRWHWALEGVTALDEPVLAKGRLGLWRPDPEMLAAVEAQRAERSAA